STFGNHSGQAGEDFPTQHGSGSKSQDSSDGFFKTPEIFTERKDHRRARKGARRKRQEQRQEKIKKKGKTTTGNISRCKMIQPKSNIFKLLDRVVNGAFRFKLPQLTH
ncbi:MAG TPA: hypothetical protein VMX16_11570, partial [Terriglobia bacterium]|nr:hypothetical protein [Terriglobia bacterium]